MTHTSRCECAKGDVKTCRCSCRGKRHGGKQDQVFRYQKSRFYVGDMVRIREDDGLLKVRGKICFVEEVLTERCHRQKEQVSLYGVDGDYVGDYSEDEFVELGRRISAEELEGLIKKNKRFPGLVKDFTRVLEVIKGEGVQVKLGKYV